MQHTLSQYDSVIEGCRSLFFGKFADYGTAWRVMRMSSLTDQLFIKAQRIRTLETVGQSKVAEGIVPEFMGIVNYGIISLIQMSLPSDAPLELERQEMEQLYSRFASQARSLMQDKNHDYGEAWRSMRCSSLTDLILMKLHRTKQIEDRAGQTCVSEGVDANYYDMINYAVFALIKLTLENKSVTIS